MGRPRKPIYGVGINDADYDITNCPFYEKWRAMLTRCYSPKFHARSPSYTSCTVEDSWKTFSNFKAWMEQQPWQNKSLDKDLLNWGNKHYGPNTCLFVTSAINSLLALRGNDRGAYPLGVIRTVVRKKYVYFEARCSFYGVQTRLGSFKTPEEAAEVYRRGKLQYIAELAAAEPDPRVRQALLALH